VVYSGVPDNAYKVFSKAQKHVGKKTTEHGTKNPAGLYLMFILNLLLCMYILHYRCHYGYAEQ